MAVLSSLFGDEAHGENEQKGLFLLVFRLRDRGRGSENVLTSSRRRSARKAARLFHFRRQRADSRHHPQHLVVLVAGGSDGRLGNSQSRSSCPFLVHFFSSFACHPCVSPFIHSSPLECIAFIDMICMFGIFFLPRVGKTEFPQLYFCRGQRDLKVTVSFDRSVRPSVGPSITLYFFCVFGHFKG